MFAAALAVAATVILLKDDPKPPPLFLLPPEEAGELVVMVRPGPVVYFPGPNGTLAGLDVDLVRQFAAEKKLPLRFVLADSAAAVIAAVGSGDVHFGAGGLFRPQAGAVVDAATPASRSAESPTAALPSV